MVSPANIVYSTNPRSWFDTAGTEYVVKGPAPEVVASETVAYALAEILEIPTPSFALATLPESPDIFFASEKITSAIRDVEPVFRSASNPSLEGVARIIAFDSWIANTDRNIGNLLCRMSTSMPSGTIEIVAIDFEKSNCLRERHPITTSNNLPPADLWPSGILGEYMRGCAMPDDTLQRIESFDKERLSEMISGIANLLHPGYDWFGSTVDGLSWRMDRIRRIAQETWR